MAGRTEPAGRLLGAALHLRADFDTPGRQGARKASSAAREAFDAAAGRDAAALLRGGADLTAQAAAALALPRSTGDSPSWPPGRADVGHHIDVARGSCAR